MKDKMSSNRGNQWDRFLILYVMKHLSFFGKSVDECVRKTCYS